VLLSAALLDNFISEYTTSCKWCVVTVDDAINWSVVRLYFVYQSSLLFASVHRYSCQSSCQSLPWNGVFLFALFGGFGSCCYLFAMLFLVVRGCFCVSTVFAVSHAVSFQGFLLETFLEGSHDFRLEQYSVVQGSLDRLLHFRQAVCIHLCARMFRFRWAV
jgi:hypothetical protein